MNAYLETLIELMIVFCRISVIGQMATLKNCQMGPGVRVNLVKIKKMAELK